MLRYCTFDNCIWFWFCSTNMSSLTSCKTNLQMLLSKMSTKMREKVDNSKAFPKSAWSFTSAPLGIWMNKFIPPHSGDFEGLKWPATAIYGAVCIDWIPLSHLNRMCLFNGMLWDGEWTVWATLGASRWVIRGFRCLIWNVTSHVTPTLLTVSMKGYILIFYDLMFQTQPLSI